mgnify:CR=1 FL=1
MTKYRDYIEDIAKKDAKEVIKKDIEYGASWQRRGGVGAFMMLARKWDRIESALVPHPLNSTIANSSGEHTPVAPWDIFGALEVDQRDEGMIDDIRDLRRYLILVEAEMLSRNTPQKIMKADHAASDELFKAGTPDDGGHHHIHYSLPNFFIGDKTYRKLGTADQLPYVRISKDYLCLRPQSIRESSRDQYSKFPRELNFAEWSGREEQVKDMYGFDESANKYVIKTFLEGWVE